MKSWLEHGGLAALQVVILPVATSAGCRIASGNKRMHVCCNLQEFVEGVDAGQLAALRKQDSSALDAQAAHALLLEVPAPPIYGFPVLLVLMALHLPNARLGSLM